MAVLLGEAMGIREFESDAAEARVMAGLELLAHGLHDLRLIREAHYEKP